MGEEQVNEIEVEEPVTYLYGESVALEPGVAAPGYAKHADVEEADSGWDKIERVNRITYTTTNQELAREHGFALLGIEGEVSFSWGTPAGSVIEVDDEHDIYTDEGAAAALADEEAEWERQRVEGEARAREFEAQIKARRDQMAQVLRAAGLEVTNWSIDVAMQAANHTGKHFGRYVNIEGHELYREAQQKANIILRDAREILLGRANRILQVVRAAKEVA